MLSHRIQSISKYFKKSTSSHPVNWYPLLWWRLQRAGSSSRDRRGVWHWKKCVMAGLLRRAGPFSAESKRMSAVLFCDNDEHWTTLTCIARDWPGWATESNLAERPICYSWCRWRLEFGLRVLCMFFFFRKAKQNWAAVLYQVAGMPVRTSLLIVGGDRMTVRCEPSWMLLWRSY